MDKGKIMYMQSDLFKDVKCNKCDKDIVINALSCDYGVKYEDDLVFTVPKIVIFKSVEVTAEDDGCIFLLDFLKQRFEGGPSVGMHYDNLFDKK